jgi:hypothetical protein
MDEHIQLAEAYYTVARHLRGQIERLTEVAELLETSADQICERNMHVKEPPSDSAGEQP